PTCSSSINKKTSQSTSSRRIKPPPEASHLIPEIPSMAQDYIVKIFDIKANGHCGFRAIEHAMERGQEAYMGIRKD
ncbi:uncharacterized protein VP01_9321g1, partial [Puccinia sorghi]